MKLLLIVTLLLGSLAAMSSEEGNVCIAVCKYSAGETIVIRGTMNRVSVNGPFARTRKDELVAYDLESKRIAFKKLKDKCEALTGVLLATELNSAGAVVKVHPKKATKNGSCVETTITKRIKEEAGRKLSREYTIWWN